MSREFTEGLILDLIGKRRAGRFTGDEILWAADHPEVVRWARNNHEVLSGLRSGRLKTIQREQFPCERLAPELIPDGWGVVEDVEPHKVELAQYRFRPFLKDDEKLIDYNELRERAMATRGNLGLTDTKQFLAEQCRLPVEMRNFYIVFPGTVLCDQSGDPQIMCLMCEDERWHPHYCLAVHEWGGYGRLACLK